jgi:hypothetical protein
MRTEILGLLGLGLAVGLVGPAHAEDVWVKTADQDCMVLGDAPLKDNEAATWSGSCADGRASGVGILEWIVDNKIAGIYDGGMADGRLNGEGVLRLEVEKGKGFDRLQATFVAGEAEGEVRYDAANGDTYVGSLKDGERHGIGFYRELAGVEYYGDFENGLQHGVGLLTDTEGNAYFGQFEKGAGKGAGVFEAADGSSFQGQFANSLPDGAGTYVAPNGEIYQGQFKAAKADGMVLVTKADGSQSVEEWKDGEKVK